GVMIFAALTAAVNIIFAQETGTDATATPTAWLGVALAENNGQVVVERVQSGSPADAANLLVGDVIVSFNGDAVSTAKDLSDKVKAAAPGDTATLEIQRNGESQTLEVTLGTAPTRTGMSGRDAQQEFDPLTFAQRMLNADLEAADSGYTVTNVLKSANPFQLEIGDVVTAVNGVNIADL